MPDSRRADDARDEREDKVHRADVLVVGRIDVAAPAGDVAVMLVRVRGMDFVSL